MASGMNSPELTVVQQAVLKRLLTLELPSGARVLDAPCGGTAALTLALIERGFDAVGADVDAEAETRLGQAFAKVNLDEALPWPDGTFDAAISTEGIEHLENHFLNARFPRLKWPHRTSRLATGALRPDSLSRRPGRGGFQLLHRHPRQPRQIPSRSAPE